MESFRFSLRPANCGRSRIPEQAGDLPTNYKPRKINTMSKLNTGNEKLSDGEFLLYGRGIVNTQTMVV